jgi:hypothetical protein
MLGVRQITPLEYGLNGAERKGLRSEVPGTADPEARIASEKISRRGYDY